MKKFTEEELVEILRRLIPRLELWKKPKREIEGC